MRRLALFLAFLALATSGCAGVQRAIVGPVVLAEMSAPAAPPSPARSAASEPLTPPAEARRWNVHQESSSFDITSGDLFGTYRSRMTRYRGTIAVDDTARDDTAATITLDIDMTSLESETRMLTQILREVFLEVGKHPKAHFEARLVPIAGKPGARRATGTLELHGVRRKIELDGVLRRDATSARFTAAFEFDRHLFGIVTGDKWDWTSKNDVKVTIDLRSVPERVQVDEQP
jgi:polyisoprenoid-binding protein YceI